MVNSRVSCNWKELQVVRRRFRFRKEGERDVMREEFDVMDKWLLMAGQNARTRLVDKRISRERVIRMEWTGPSNSRGRGRDSEALRPLCAVGPQSILDIDQSNTIPLCALFAWRRQARCL